MNREYCGKTSMCRESSHTDGKCELIKDRHSLLRGALLFC